MAVFFTQQIDTKMHS